VFFHIESSINNLAPLSLQAHMATAAIKHAHGLDSPALVTLAMMNEITARRKLRSILI
jgi:hypothetical protein